MFLLCKRARRLEPINLELVGKQLGNGDRAMLAVVAKEPDARPDLERGGFVEEVEHLLEEAEEVAAMVVDQARLHLTATKRTAER